MFTVPIPQNKFNQETRERLQEAIYLLGYLIQSVNWEKGMALVRHEDIAAKTGFPERTISRWMQILVEAGEIFIQKTRKGTLVYIKGYEPIAKTRGVKNYTPPKIRNTPPAASQDTPSTASNTQPNTPSAAARDATGGSQDMPHMAVRDAVGGVTNIKRILSQNILQNIFQNPSSLSLSDKAPAGARGKETPRELFEYGDSWAEKLEHARQMISALSDDARESLAKRALEELAGEPKMRFLKVFVQKNEQGELEPRGDIGVQNMLKRMGEILAREDSEKP